MKNIVDEIHTVISHSIIIIHDKNKFSSKLRFLKLGVSTFL